MHVCAGDEDERWFSFDTTEHVSRPQLNCYLTHTTPETHRLIQENLKETPIYGWVGRPARPARACMRLHTLGSRHVCACLRTSM